MLRVGLLNFSKGVLADHLLGRVDVAAYNAGLKQGENIVVLKQGGFTIRPGIRFISECLGDDERVIAFRFSDEQPYALAFGQEYLQPLSAGGVVTEEELFISGASNTSPMVLAVDNHGYSAGDMVFIQNVEGALGAYLNGRQWPVVASVDADHVSIDLNGTALPNFTAATGGIVRADPPAVPPAPPPTPPVYEPPPPPVVTGPGGVYDGGSDPPWGGPGRVLPGIIP